MTRSGFTRSITGGFQRTPRQSDMAGIAAMGRNGDTELAHVNPQEAELLKSLGGSGAINPRTGLREYALGGGPGSQSESSGGSTAPGHVAGTGHGSSYPDLFGEQQAFNAALGAFRSGDMSMGSGTSYTGPAPGLGGTVDQTRWNQSQPSFGQRAMAFGVGTAMPFGFDAQARANYIEGRPEMAVSWNPIGALTNMTPLGPLGDIQSPSWADIEVASVPFGEAQHAQHTGRSEGDSGGSEAAVGSLVRSVLRGQRTAGATDSTGPLPERDTGRNPPPPPRRFTPFGGDYAQYGIQGSGGHRFIT